MNRRRCLILADDMTGGGDTGAQFAKKRLRTLLVTAGASRRLPLDDNRWPVLVVNTHTRAMETEQARRQLTRLGQDLDIPRIEIRSSSAERFSSVGGPTRRTIVRTIAEALKAGSVILSVSGERRDTPGRHDSAAALTIAQTLGSISMKAVSLSGIDARDAAMVLTGGDTAMAVLQALGADGVEIGSEPVEGVMAGRVRGGFCGGAQIITKAGAFGEEDALLRVARMLSV
jgi:uncharacterized protein YgbK (DUF1537 family)